MQLIHIKIRHIPEIRHILELWYGSYKHFNLRELQWNTFKIETLTRTRLARSVESNNQKRCPDYQVSGCDILLACIGSDVESELQSYCNLHSVALFEYPVWVHVHRSIDIQSLSGRDLRTLRLAFIFDWVDSIMAMSSVCSGRSNVLPHSGTSMITSFRGRRFSQFNNLPILVSSVDRIVVY